MSQFFFDFNQNYLNFAPLKMLKHSSLLDIFPDFSYFMFLETKQDVLIKNIYSSVFLYSTFFEKQLKKMFFEFLILPKKHGKLLE